MEVWGGGSHKCQPQRWVSGSWLPHPTQTVLLHESSGHQARVTLPPQECTPSGPTHPTSVQSPPLCKNTGHTDLGSTLLQYDRILTRYICISPVPKYDHTLRSWRLGLKHSNLGDTTLPTAVALVQRMDRDFASQDPQSLGDQRVRQRRVLVWIAPEKDLLAKSLS